MNKTINWIKHNRIMSIVILIGIIFIVYFLFNRSGKRGENNLASCLKQKGAKMYGAYYCGYCNQQKQILGNSSDIPYIECIDKNGKSKEECSKLNVASYPTWIFSDGKRISGLASVEQLKQYAGC